MGYQALLFCPDEKTARTVTQVLSELDFTVVPCTEPFAAVKKLMGEHFDAVVVDCDNEQNATLLFKSARNTTHNQSALAVAVVEGQAGVAKAFRIGANLVLTKPINVEQAKGTLRVARGLLRKNETKPATGAASTAGKAAVPVAAAAKAAPQRPMPTAFTPRPAAPVAPRVTVAAASVPTQKPAEQPRVAASAASKIPEDDLDLFEVSEEEPSASMAKPAGQISVASVPKVSAGAASGAAAAKSAVAGSHPASWTGIGTGAASAPAPAREPKASEIKAPAIDSEIETPVIETASSSSSVGEVAAPAPDFTFGGNAKPAGGGSKKALLAVAAVVVVAALGYAVWMQWQRSSGAEVGPVHVTAQPVTAPAKVPQMTPAVPATTTSAPSAAASSPAASPDSAIPSSTPDSAPASHASVKTSDTHASAENAPVHSSKISVDPDSSKPSAAAVAAKEGPATKTAVQPIMIKPGTSKAAKPAALADAPAPSLTGIAPVEGGALPSLLDSPSKAPTPVLQSVTVSQGVSQGLLVKKVQPVYPPVALRMHLEGAVQLMATISKSGDISAVKILGGDPGLARAAVAAVKQWKYKPYLLNGSPVEIQTQITMNFKLP
jgi:protein TonB